MQSETIDERKSEGVSMDDEQFANSDSPVRNHEDLFIERPFSISPNTRPVNGNLDPDDEDEDEDEDDLILGDETAAGDEEEFDVELEDEFDEDDVDEDDLVIDSDDDIDEDDEEDDDL
ncbi:MAG: hypothetical protein ACJ75B_15705 [Flavisolibacter sp.]|jgi:hypothetical protein